MKVLCEVVFLVTAFIASTRGGPVGSLRIINGTEISIEKVPYQVYLESKCGGSILTKRHIVTAAHCVFEKDCEFIRAGSSNKESGGQVVNILKKIFHPKWDYDTASHDFVLLVLAEELVFNENVQSITLAREPVPDGTMFLVSGWGDTNDSSIDERFLRAVELPQINHDECKEMYVSIDGPNSSAVDESMMCVGYVDSGKSFCSRDSGGPLIYNKTLYGVVSWKGRPCDDPRFPGVSGSIPTVYDWYMNLIQDLM